MPRISCPPLRPLAPQPIRRASSTINREPALGQFDGGVDTGEPTANHTNVGDQVRRQFRTVGHAMSRSGVIRARVFLGVLVHWLDFTLLQERVIKRMIDWGGVVEM